MFLLREGQQRDLNHIIAPRGIQEHRVTGNQASQVVFLCLQLNIGFFSVYSGLSVVLVLF